jgi:hypothetical protein
MARFDGVFLYRLCGISETMRAKIGSMATTTAMPRHQCLIYDGSAAKHLPGLASMIVKQLAAYKRCLYLNSPAMVEDLRSALLAAGLNTVREEKRGALILSSDQSHLTDGGFDPAVMIAMLKDAVAQAKRDGFSGFWASGDMAWEFGNEKNLMKLLEYECQLEDLFLVEPDLAGVCQYHSERLPSIAIQEAIATHRAIYFSDTVSRMNPYYVSDGSAGMRRPPLPEMQVKSMVAALHAIA